MRLKDRVAIVTGSGQGIGKEIAIAMAREGAKLVIISRSETASQTLKEIETLGFEAIAVRIDVADRTQTEEMAEKTLAAFGRIDVLVNNAAIMSSASISDLDQAQWDEVMDINLKGVFNCTQAVLPAMKEQKRGSIINLASLSGGVIGLVGGGVHYASSKGGIVGFTRQAAVELGCFGIRVNAVAPGFVPTARLKAMGIEAGREMLEGLIPLGRLGKPADIAGPVLFLASDESGYITGQLIVVDGGYSIQ